MAAMAAMAVGGDLAMVVATATAVVGYNVQ